MVGRGVDEETGAPAAATNFLSWSLLAEHWLEELRARRNPISLDEFETR